LEEQLNFLSKEAEAERGRNASEISRLGGVLDQARREGDQMQKALSYLKCEKEELEVGNNNNKEF
jgi:hypothetical protein